MVGFAGSQVTRTSHVIYDESSGRARQGAQNKERGIYVKQRVFEDVKEVVA